MAGANNQNPFRRVFGAPDGLLRYFCETTAVCRTGAGKGADRATDRIAARRLVPEPPSGSKKTGRVACNAEMGGDNAATWSDGYELAGG